MGPFPYDWERIDERPDPQTIRQENEARCTAACLLMLLGAKAALSQSQLAAPDYLTDEPAPIDRILPTLRSLDPAGRWSMIIQSENEPVGHVAIPTPWLAILLLSRPQMRFEGHSVIVDQLLPKGEILLRDPLQATSYRMHQETFNARWNGIAFFRNARKKATERNPKPI